ncbi:MAG TPA: hypothetical protein VN643_07750 [Pyrinomonadaceae bacterium]|nr:hypothetical protein [Pyrinomonadaceae bacterium]
MEKKSIYITLRGTNSALLRVAPSGPSRNQIFADAEEWAPEMFELIELGSDERGRKVALKSLSTGLYLRALDGGGREVMVNGRSIEAWETFVLTRKEHTVFLKAANGQYLGDDHDKRIVAAFPDQRAFTIAERRKSMFVTVRSPNGFLWSVTPKDASRQGQIFANGKDEMPEIFELIELGSDHRGRTVALQAVSNGRYVAAEKEGGSPLVANRGAVQEWEAFVLSPGPAGTIRLMAHNGLYVGEESSLPRMVAAFAQPGNQQFKLEERRGREENYPEHFIEPELSSTTHAGLTGCYFQGHVYLFHQVVFLQEQTRHLTAIIYSKVRLKGDRTIEVLEKNQPLVEGLIGLDRQYSLAACVHKGALYLFWNSSGGALRYISTINGKEWTATKAIPNVRVEGDRQVAALSLGERLYVFGSLRGQVSGEITCQLVIAYSDDDGGNWASEISSDWKNVRHLAACTFAEPDGKIGLMLGMTTEFWNLWTARYDFQPEGAGSRLSLVKSQEHSDLRGLSDFISLAAGSIKDGGRGSVVQMFVNGHGETGTPTKKREYSVATGRWSHLSMLSGEFTRHPTRAHTGAFQCLLPIVNPNTMEVDEVQQEIWYMTTYQGPFPKFAHVYFARWQSDKLKQWKTDSAIVPTQFRSLLGVVEGPPPYALNGQEFREGVSKFQFGFATAVKVQVAATFKMGAYVKFGGTLYKAAGAALTLTYDVTHKEQTSKEVKTSVVKDIGPVLSRNQVTYIYLRPTVVRKTFKLYDWSGAEIENAEVYVFNPSGCAVDFDTANILSQFPGKPDTHNFESWRHRMTAPPSYAHAEADTAVTWDQQGDVSLTITTERSTLKSRETTIKGEIEGGVENIFYMGGNKSYSFEEEHSSTVSQALGVTLSYPRPRAGQPDDFAKVILRVFVLTPREDAIQQCYWIPKDKQSQRPWCVAWSVDSTQTKAERELELARTVSATQTK